MALEDVLLATAAAFKQEKQQLQAQVSERSEKYALARLLCGTERVLYTRALLAH
jgi:hypothetical protein